MVRSVIIKHLKGFKRKMAAKSVIVTPAGLMRVYSCTDTIYVWWLISSRWMFVQEIGSGQHLLVSWVSFWLRMNEVWAEFLENRRQPHRNSYTPVTSLPCIEVKFWTWNILLQAESRQDLNNGGFSGKRYHAMDKEKTGYKYSCSWCTSIVVPDDIFRIACGLDCALLSFLI